jgi:polysaccharide chain length determinant protein (PEP-CTERM system associated)
MQIAEQILDDVKSAWRFRWKAMALAWAVCIVGWLVVMAMPNRYEAKTQVYVDASTGLKPLLEGLAVDQDVESQLQLVRQAMLGRPALEKVARETDLYLDASTPEQFEAMIDGLATEIQITNVFDSARNTRIRSSDSLFQISYQHPERDKALAVVREVLDTFVEDTLGGNRSGSESAQRFLEAQVQEYAKRLNDQEARLAEFKQSNLGMVPGESGGYFARLDAETARVKQARADLAVAMGRSDELRRQLRGEVTNVSPEAMAAGTAGLPATDTSVRLAEARARLDELSLRFTDKHPDVVATRETIRQLEERQRLEVEALRSGNGPTPAALASNPVYQSIQMALNQSEVQVAELRRQIAQGESNIADLQRLAKTAPEVEARFRELTRDFEVTRAQYTSLLERLEKARLSGQADQTGIVRFEVIDPPQVGLQPVSPNRPMLSLLVLLGGLAAGAGLAYLLSMQKPVFLNTRTLTEATGLPVLGSVSAALTAERTEARRKDRMAYAGAMAGLLVVFVALIAVQGSAGAFLSDIVG